VNKDGLEQDELAARLTEVTNDTVYDPEIIAKLSETFDLECQTRHDMGAKKYGQVKFLEVNSLQMAMEEVADLANYARYTWIKLALLKAQASEFETVLEALQDGRDSIILNGEGPKLTPQGFTNPHKKQV
jgi:hypothetical protein